MFSTVRELIHSSYYNGKYLKTEFPPWQALCNFVCTRFLNELIMVVIKMLLFVLILPLGY